MDHADLEIGALTITTSPTPIVGNVYVQTCGHHLHLRCWNSYITSLRGGVQRYNPDRYYHDIAITRDDLAENEFVTKLGPCPIQP